ncbi:hypothetical protein Mycsm_04933 [Mycobacterium sp. JS623]|uniref:hypothetical protein n=1 Tax=Mycobacterium sp. JS623 TaxID=212767 RepID=UPI0002A5A2AA|nr:hypothetical protein [Mycobacterium sp. JS623]AGB25151.1 hypothetical protein Mycsm_04933 [Mycobacterium sp. JS623]
MITVADAKGHAGQTFRLEGQLASKPAYWAPKGTGRGGNNYAGAGVLVDLSSGGQALLLAESDFPPPSDGGRVLVLLTTP